MRIGVDVGGTNTDAALMDGAMVLASVKSPTTDDIACGVISSNWSPTLKRFLTAMLSQSP